MKLNIKAIFFDIGNTLRVLTKEPKFQEQAENQLTELIGVTEEKEVFFEKLNKRWDLYREQSKKTLVEASEMELWTRWMLPEYPAESIAAVSGKLTRLWRDRDGRRNPRPDVKDTIVELVKRGFNLGIIANTITETEIPDWIIDDGLVSCFYPVILSSKVRIRKPDPSIYLLAARILGVEPSECAYIGDNPVRDVEGARKSEFGSVILINEPNTVANETEHIVYEPDYTIDKISDLLNIFPRAHGCLRAEKTTP